MDTGYHYHIPGISFSRVLITTGLAVSAALFNGCEQFSTQQAVQAPQLAQMPAGAEAQSGNTWIEYPPDGEVYPLEPLEIVVYAAGAGGAGRINLRVNGQEIPQGPITSLNQEGTLVRMDGLWLPQAEGEYLLEAQAEGGSPASIRVCIVTCQPGTTPSSSETVTITPSGTSGTETPTPSLTPTITTTGTQAVTIQFWVNPTTISGGQCANLNWSASGAQAVYLDGASVPSSGYDSVCPCESTTYRLQVIKSDGISEDRNLTLEVYGSCEVETEAPALPSDTSGPDISGTYLVWEGCSLFGQAQISDPSAVSWAQFHYNLNSQGWAWINMNDTGSGLWESQVGVSVSDGIGSPTGSIQYYFKSGDSLYNETTSSTKTFNYTGCGGTY